MLLLAPHAQTIPPQVERVLPAPRAPEKEELQSLPWMTAVLTEALRLYPPAYITTRKADHSFEVAGNLLVIVSQCHIEAVVPGPVRWALGFREDVESLDNSSRIAREVDGVAVPQGVDVWINIMGLHRTPSVYPDPDK